MTKYLLLAIVMALILMIGGIRNHQKRLVWAAGAVLALILAFGIWVVWWLIPAM